MYNKSNWWAILNQICWAYSSQKVLVFNHIAFVYSRCRELCFPESHFLPVLDLSLPQHTWFQLIMFVLGFCGACWWGDRDEMTVQVSAETNTHNVWICGWEHVTMELDRDMPEVNMYCRTKCNQITIQSLFFFSLWDMNYHSHIGDYIYVGFYIKHSQTGRLFPRYHSPRVLPLHYVKDVMYRTKISDISDLKQQITKLMSMIEEEEEVDGDFQVRLLRWKALTDSWHSHEQH